MSDQFWLDGKVLRKGKEYVGEFAAYEPLLLRELLTDKQAQKAQPPCGADGVVPEKTSGDAPFGLSINGADGWARGWNDCRAMLASQPAAPVAPATVAGADGWGIYRAYGSKGELLLVHNEQKAVATSIDENNPAYGILNAMLAASQREGGVT